MTSGGENFNDFPENQLSESCVVYIIKANWGPKFCHYSDWIDVFSLSEAHLLNRKAAALHFTRVYTVCLQYAMTKYWQKA